jgi:hypothetical protein
MFADTEPSCEDCIKHSAVIAAAEASSSSFEERDDQYLS